MAARSNPLPPGGGVYNPSLVKAEKSEAEKIYLMTEASDTMKEAHGRLFPLNPPQKPSRLKTMFAAPRGVGPNRRNKNFFMYLITDIGTYEVKSKTSFAPSVALEKMWMKKDQIHPSIKNAHMSYAAQNLLFVKVYSKLVLVFETAPFLQNSNENNMAKCLSTSRVRWFAANLIHFPTSPQVMAAQLIRNHARIYSEDIRETPDAASYQLSVKRLVHYCTGMERALVPEGHMPIENHMRMTWYRIRKRVLERMYEEAQKIHPQTQQETNFLTYMPFVIKSIPDLLRKIKEQMEECDVLWNKEKDGEIELSDGADMEEEEEDDMEFDDSMRGQTQNQQRAAPSYGQLQQPAPSHGQQQQQQQYPLLPDSSVSLPPAASRMNQLYNFGVEQKKKSATTLASALGPQVAMRPHQTAAFPHGGMPRSGEIEGGGGGIGRGGMTLPQMTPTSTNGGARGGVKVQMRRDQLVDTPSALPSTSATLNRRGEDVPIQQPAPAHTHLPPHSHSTLQQKNVQAPPTAPPPITPSPIAPLPSTLHIPPTASPSTAPPLNAPPLSTLHTPTDPPSTVVAQPQSTTPHVLPYPLFSSPQLMVQHADGVIQPLPSIVYVERSENGLMQVSTPTPNPQLLMAIPWTSGRRERNISLGKRRMSLPRKELKKRRTGYEGCSEESEDEQKRQRAKERRKKYEKQKKEERERIEKEERDEREKEEREDEEFRKKEEAKKKEEEDRKKKEEEDRKIREEEDRKAVAERERKEEEEEEEEDERKRKKKEEEEAVKEAEEERVEEKDEYEASDENEMDEGEEEMRVLAEDSSDESECEERMESEDEVVAESVIAQSDNEEMEESRETERKEETGVSGVSGGYRPSIVVPTQGGGDSDIEVVFEGIGEKRPMSIEYCEVVSELVKVKKELNEKVDNEVIMLKEKKGMRSLSSNLGTTSDKRRRFNRSIKETIDKVKEENENEKESEKEKEKERRGVEETSKDDVCNQPPPTTRVKTVKREEKEETKKESNSGNTEMTEVKSEMKEEEEDEIGNEEEQEEEAMVTMIERRNGEGGYGIEDTLNRSAELNFLTTGEDEVMERSRIVLEAMTQDESSEIPLTAVSAVTPLPLIEDSSIAQSSPTQVVPSPLITPLIQEDTMEKEKEGDMEIERATVPLTGDESAVRMSTPPPRPPLISVFSQSGKTDCGERIPRLQTRLSAQQLEMINNVDSLCMPYVKGFQRRGLKDTEKEKVDELEKDREVEVIKELPPIETDVDILKFHSMRGIAAVLSEDRRSAIRDEEVDSCSKALVFTNRPLYKGERVTLRVIETSTAWKGRIRLGLTTKNPLLYASRNDIPKFREAQSDHENLSYLYDSGAMNDVKKGTVLEVELTEKGDVLNYWFDGNSMGAMGGGLQIARPMWLILDIYGYVKGIQIVDSSFPPQEACGIDVPSGNEMAFVLKNEINEEVIPSEKMGMKKEEVSTQETKGRIGKETRETDAVTTEKKNGEEGMVEEEEGMEDENGASGDKGDEEAVIAEEGMGEEENRGKRMREGEEKSVDGDGVEEEEEEPPMKKLRIEGESSYEAENEKEKEETKEKTVLNSLEMEVRENEEPAVDSVEIMDDGSKTTDGDEVINVDDSGMKEMEKIGEEERDIDDDGGVKRVEEEEMVKNTEEEKENYGHGMGVIEDGDTQEKAANENGNVKEGEKDKEGDTIEESIDTMGMKSASLVIQKATEREEEVEEIDTAVESTDEEERMKMELTPDAPVPLPRRRSMFGPGCLPFERTLEAKEENGTEEEEEKMEVDEKEGVTSIRRRSLFGPGSISFNHLINKIHEKE